MQSCPIKWLVAKGTDRLLKPCLLTVEVKVILGNEKKVILGNEKEVILGNEEKVKELQINFFYAPYFSENVGNIFENMETA